MQYVFLNVDIDPQPSLCLRWLDSALTVNLRLCLFTVNTLKDRPSLSHRKAVCSGKHGGISCYLDEAPPKQVRNSSQASGLLCFPLHHPTAVALRGWSVVVVFIFCPFELQECVRDPSCAFLYLFRSREASWNQDRFRQNTCFFKGHLSICLPTLEINIFYVSRKFVPSWGLSIPKYYLLNHLYSLVWTTNLLIPKYLENGSMPTRPLSNEQDCSE